MSLPAERIQPDPWLADIFERQVYRVDLDETVVRKGLLDQQDAIEQLCHRRAFVYAKIPVHEVAAAGCLQKLGFRVVDTNVVYEGPAPLAGAANDAPGVRSARPQDRNEVVRLASRSFQCSRFHLDPAIPGDLADTIKARWVESYFCGRRGQEMLIAERDGVVAGFALLLIQDTTVVIDLIAVSEAHRRRGLAASLMRRAAVCDGACRRIRVGTQLANQASIRLYERLGLRLSEANYVLHYYEGTGAPP